MARARVLPARDCRQTRALALLGGWSVLAEVGGDLEAARGYAEELVAVRRSLGDDEHIAGALLVLANVDAALGHQDAAASLRRGRRHARPRGSSASAGQDHRRPRLPLAAPRRTRGRTCDLPRGRVAVRRARLRRGSCRSVARRSGRRAPARRSGRGPALVFRAQPQPLHRPAARRRHRLLPRHGGGDHRARQGDAHRAAILFGQAAAGGPRSGRQLRCRGSTAPARRHGRGVVAALGPGAYAAALDEGTASTRPRPSPSTAPDPETVHDACPVGDPRLMITLCADLQSHRRRHARRAGRRGLVKVDVVGRAAREDTPRRASACPGLRLGAAVRRRLDVTVKNLADDTRWGRRRGRERRQRLAELPPAVHMRLDDRRCAVGDRDQRRLLGDRHPVGGVVQLSRSRSRRSCRARSTSSSNGAYA